MGYGHCLSTLEIFQRALSGPDGLLAGKALKTLVNTCTVNPQQPAVISRRRTSFPNAVLPRNCQAVQLILKHGVFQGRA